MKHVCERSSRLQNKSEFYWYHFYEHILKWFNISICNIQQYYCNNAIIVQSCYKIIITRYYNRLVSTSIILQLLCKYIPHLSLMNINLKEYLYYSFFEFQLKYILLILVLILLSVILLLSVSKFLIKIRLYEWLKTNFIVAKYKTNKSIHINYF